MYQIVIRRRAVKDLANLPSNYQNLVGQHINDLAQNPRPQDAKKLKGNYRSCFACRCLSCSV